MAQKIHDVCICEVALGPVDYARPCVVIRVADDSLTILPISSKLYESEHPFVIHDYHPNFSATGLSVTSYVYGAPVARIEPAKVKKVIGAITGDLEREFKKWIE
jgi:hypothetical protein